MKYPPVKNFAAGRFLDSTCEQSPVVSPLDGSLLSQAPRSTAAEVATAVAAAKEAYPSWSNQTIKQRAAVAYRNAGYGTPLLIEPDPAPVRRRIEDPEVVVVPVVAIAAQPGATQMGAMRPGVEPGVQGVVLLAIVDAFPAVGDRSRRWRRQAPSDHHDRDGYERGSTTQVHAWKT